MAILGSSSIGFCIFFLTLEAYKMIKRKFHTHTKCVNKISKQLVKCVSTFHDYHSEKHNFKKNAFKVSHIDNDHSNNENRNCRLISSANG